MRSKICSVFALLLASSSVSALDPFSLPDLRIAKPFVLSTELLPGRLPGAFKVFKANVTRAEALPEERLASRLIATSIAIRIGKLKEAERLIADYPAEVAGTSLAYVLRLQLAAEREDVLAVISICETIESKFPDSDFAMLKRAQFLSPLKPSLTYPIIDKEDIESPLEPLQDYLDALRAMRNRKWERAMKAILSIQLHPTHWLILPHEEAYILGGRFFLPTLRVDRARRNAEFAIEINPYNMRALKLLHEIALRQKNKQLAARLKNRLDSQIAWDK